MSDCIKTITEDCQYETWQEKVTQVFKPLGLTVRYLVSDRAKAIVKLALKDSRNGIRIMKNQIESLSAIVDLWWSWVDQCLAAGGCEINLGELPQPRKSRKSSQTQTFTLPTVPS